MSVVNLADHQENTRKTPSQIWRSWKSSGYRIKSRVAILLWAEHGKRRLKDGTAETLEKDIMTELEFLAKQRKALSPSDLHEVLAGIKRQRKLWEKSPNWWAIEKLVSITRTQSDVFFVRAFLAEIIGIKKDTIDTIILKNLKHGNT